MKLLLTSAGISNKKIELALLSLLGKPFNQSSLLFIPTAANVEDDKSYVSTDLDFHQKLGYKNIQVLDIASVDIAAVESAVKQSDVVWFSGGNTFYLLQQLRQTGLDKKLSQLLEGKVYGGTSAGSIVATTNINVAFVEPADTNGVGLTDFTGLNLVNFEFSPHSYDLVKIEDVIKYSQTTTNTIYVVDDQGAVKVDGDLVDIITTGQSQKIN